MTLKELADALLMFPKGKKHARRAWGGKAYVTWMEGNPSPWIVKSDGICAPYGMSFDDLMADDWEIVE